MYNTIITNNFKCEKAWQLNYYDAIEEFNDWTVLDDFTYNPIRTVVNNLILGLILRA